MKRVLIITYYWPPSGGSGVQRWLKMSKYLPEYGWQPVIYTPENAEYPVEDPSLLQDVAPEAEVIKRKIVEPYSFYKQLLGIKKEQKVKVGFINEGERKQGWKENLSLWVRGNLFIPDARCWWVKPSVRFLKKYLKKHPVDAIISTGPPHSMHMIAMKLHKVLSIPWIADFRDPWTEIDYYGQLHLTRRSDRKQHELEHEVLTQADQVVTVAPDGARRLEALDAHNVRTVYNGFDWNVEDQNTGTQPQSEKFNLTYIGVLSKIQNPENLWEAIGEFVEEDKAFGEKLQINMIGQIDQSVVAAIRKAKLERYAVFKPYIPHNQVFLEQRTSDVLLLLLMPESTPRAKGLLTGKLFEYLSSGTPILCIGPEDGDAAHIIETAKAGQTVGFGKKGKMKETIKALFSQYETGTLQGCDNQSIEKYSRKALTGEFVEMMDNLTDNHKTKVCHLVSKHKMNDMRVFEKECKSLARGGFDVTLIGFGEQEKEEVIDGVKCISLYYPIKNNLELLLKRNKLTYREALKVDAKIYHIHEPELLPIGKKLKRRGKIVIFDSHEYYGWQLRDNIHKIKIVNVPASFMKTIGNLYMRYEKRICMKLDAVIQVCTMNGIDYFKDRCKRTLFIRNLPDISDYTRENEISFDNPISISMIGGITRERGVTQLVKAAGETDAKLNLAGNFIPKSYEDELKQMPEYKNVNYCGFLDKKGMVSLLEETSIGASTLLNIGQYDKIDTFPTKVYDYMAMKLPVIISNTSFAKEMNGKYNFAICVDPNNADEIAQAIQWLKDHPQEAVKMGENGRKIIENEWNWEKESLKLLDFYNELLILHDS